MFFCRITSGASQNSVFSVFVFSQQFITQSRCHSFHPMCCTVSHIDLLLPGCVLYLDTRSWIFMFTFSGVNAQKGLNLTHEASSSSSFPRYTPDHFKAFFDNLKGRQILLSSVCETWSHITCLSHACSNQSLRSFVLSAHRQLCSGHQLQNHSITKDGKSLYTPPVQPVTQCCTVHY